MDLAIVDETGLGWVGRDERQRLKEVWATAIAIRELYENQPPDETQKAARAQRRPMR